MQLTSDEIEIVRGISALSVPEKHAILVLTQLMNMKPHIDKIYDHIEIFMNPAKTKTLTPEEQLMQAIDNSEDPCKAADIVLSVITKYLQKNNFASQDEIKRIVSNGANINPLTEKEIEILTKSNTDWTEQEWTEYPTFNAVDVNSSDDGGYIYAAEYGEYIKIGYTVSPRSRLGNHAATAKNYGNITTGRVLLSPPHKTYQKTEKLLHEYFKAYRKDGTELFEVSFDELKAQIRSAIHEIQEEAK